MSSIDDRILKNIERSKQRELRKIQEDRQKQAREVHAKRKQIALAKDRHKIIGEIVSYYFPEVDKFYPYRTNEEKQKEFIPLIKFLSELSKDKKYISMLKEKIFNK